MWRELLERRGVRLEDDEPAARSTPEEMDDAEAALGFDLPSSYRTFCQELGAGSLCDYFAIFAPAGGRHGYDLVRKAERAREDLARIPELPDAVPFEAEDFVLFCNAGEGVAFGWVLDDGDAEPEIWCIDLAEEPWGHRVAAGFESFVRDVCLGNRLIEVGLYTDTDWRDGCTWQPMAPAR